MKFIMLLSLLCTSSLALANGPTKPSAFCESNKCTSKMKMISELYETGNADFASLKFSVYSGDCYHLNPLYKPEHKHYGIMSFENKAQEFSNTGFWAFFLNEDPYLGKSAIEIKHDLESRYTSHAGEIFDTHTELGFQGPGTNTNYWFRSTTDLKKMYVIGRWLGGQDTSSVDRYMFCEFDRR